MVFKSLEELQVYQEAVDAADAISAIVTRASFRSDPALKSQLRDSAGGVASQISEGFAQKTDRHFAHYLYVARGSSNETRTHLRVAQGRQYITRPELEDLVGRYVKIGKMLTRLIQHLEREDRKRRG